MISRASVESVFLDPICVENCCHHTTITLKNGISFDIVQACGSTIYGIIRELGDDSINNEMQHIWQTSSIRDHFYRYKHTSTDETLKELDSTLDRLFQISLGADFQK